MKRRLEIVIYAGDATCIVKGQKCQWVTTSHFGTGWWCGIFGNALLDNDGGQEGPLRRTQQCMDHEVSNVR